MSELNRIAILSGKMNGTKTLQSTFDNIENPDEIEKFLSEFFSLKLQFQLTDKVHEIHDDRSLRLLLKNINDCEYISIFTDADIDKIFLTDEDNSVYEVFLKEINESLISKLINKETLTKFLLNAYPFEKWCLKKKIEMKNCYDIPICIKILTNNVNPFQSIEQYIKQYTDYDSVRKEKEYMLFGSFILNFGKYLYQNVRKFNLDSIYKLIFENTYYELINTNNEENCRIHFGYSNLQQVIKSVMTEKLCESNSKEYILSPLGRIAIKYGQKEETLFEELYREDITLSILNELFNNNIYAQIDDDGSFVVQCRYKNISNVFSLVTAILDDVFYTMFHQTFEASIRCEIKE